DRLVLGDPRHQVLVLVQQRLALQRSQPAQLHVEDGPGLRLVDLQQLHQALLGDGGGLAAPDQRDHLVDPVDRLQQRADGVRPLLGHPEQVPGAPDDDLDLVGDPVPDHLVQPQRPRHAVDQREHVRAERVLQLGVLVQVVQHDLGHRVAAQHDHQPLAGAAAALVADVGDSADPAVAYQISDLRGQVVRVDLVGQLGDDQAGPAAAVLVDVHHGAHGDRAAPGPVGILDAAAADDQPAGREVRSLDPLDQRFQQLYVAGLEVVQEPPDARGDLTQVVRRDL